MKKAVIVDLDGTIANSDERLHHIRKLPKDWDSFHAEAYNDIPIDDIIFVVKALYSAGMQILICTARSEDNRVLTTKWLEDKSGLKGLYEKIYMRSKGDLRDDSIIKIELLEEMRRDGFNPVMAIDDRNHVVKAWRDSGIRCLHVCDGNY